MKTKMMILSTNKDLRRKYLGCRRVFNEQGTGRTAYNLARCYADELDDPVEAFRWFFNAAELGFLAAWRSLGAMYELGRGIETDLVQAYICYFRSLQGGWSGILIHHGDLEDKTIIRVVSRLQQLVEVMSDVEISIAQEELYRLNIRVVPGAYYPAPSQKHDAPSSLEAPWGKYHM